MAKFCGLIGYQITVEIEPGVYEEQFVVNQYYGDVIRNSRRLQDTTNKNSNVTISNQISIIADPFANSHFHEMRYIEWMGVRWTISNIEVQYPRMILTIGDIYNG